MKYYSFNDIEHLLGEPKLIEARIIDYIVWLRENQKLSAGTIQFYLAAIMHFYAMQKEFIDIAAHELRTPIQRY